MADESVGMSSLQAMPLFAGVNQHDLENILKTGEILSFGPGQAVVERGETGDALFIVLVGTANVEWGGGDLELRAGDLFGEMALVEGKPRTATVRAAEPLQALRVRAEDFQRFLIQHPHVGLSMLKSLIERWGDIQGRLEAWAGKG